MMRKQMTSAAIVCLSGSAIGLGSPSAATLTGPAASAPMVRSLMPDEVPVDEFVNFESPHVHPMDMTPDGRRLLAVNTADNRLEVLSLTSDLPRREAAVPVGLDPVAVRARTSDEAWVVNHISDSVSVVDLNTMNVVRTIDTKDEPADVVFSRGLAFVTCSQANVVQVFDVTNGALQAEIPIQGEDPREMVLSPDGSTIYVAIFESGNASTILAGGGLGTLAFPPNVVNDPAGPYGGVNPPPNGPGGVGFSPPEKPGNPTPLKVGLIVKRDANGAWRDDQGADWTNLVSGPQAGLSGRVVGWDMVDHDVAVIDVGSLSVSGYQTGLMNADMAIGLNPGTGEVTVVGTDATNEIRFEPNLNGRFVRVMGASFPAGTGVANVNDLNDHLTYVPGPIFSPIPQTDRNKSIGDPRAIVWTADGSRGYVAGMGSNNVIVVDPSMQRATTGATIDVGQGPTGLVLDEDRGWLYVMNKFDATISVVDIANGAAIDGVALYDPSPDIIKDGRPFLYDTHLTSGLGQASCASCHIDARFDRLAWDLGNPAGDVKPFDQNCLDQNCQAWHPMKGPMTTQTMRDIIGQEPHHWRADRFGIENFSGAFASILGDDQPLPPAEMQQFEDFLSTIHFPPNPFRNFDNSLPTNLPLPGHLTTGRFGPAGQPLPNGDATLGLLNYRFGQLDGAECVTCHTLQTGMGTNFELQGVNFVPIPAGPNGELHHAVVSVDGSTNISIKIPQLRNMYEKGGFNMMTTQNTAGFGFLHDGSVDSIERFVAEPVFSFNSDQEIADMVAFMLAFSGSDLPTSSGGLFDPPGGPSKDAHAAVGKQVTLPNSDPALLQRLSAMVTLADAGEIGLVVKGMYNGELRGFTYVGANLYQSDRAAEAATHAMLVNAAGVGSELTFTAVAKRTENRIGIDRDLDGFFDQDELDSCADPADPASTPNNSTCCLADVNHDGALTPGDFTAWIAAFNANAPECDQNLDGNCDPSDFTAWIANFNAGCP